MGYFKDLAPVLDKVFVFSDVERVAILGEFTCWHVVRWVLSLLGVGDRSLVTQTDHVGHLLRIRHLQLLYLVRIWCLSLVVIGAIFLLFQSAKPLAME